jgi:hypothetical protein
MAREVTDIDRGWRQSVASMGLAAQHPAAHVVVGWPERKAGQQHRGSTMTVAQIAAVHEFGAPARGIPERSMLRETIRIHDGKYRDAMRKIGLGITAGKIDQRRGLDLLGVMIKGDVQQRIAAGIAPALKPATVRRKGSSTPLIDTGQMRGSLDHEVRGV